MKVLGIDVVNGCGGWMYQSATVEAKAMRLLMEVVWKNPERKRNRESGTECMKQERSPNANNNI